MLKEGQMSNQEPQAQPVSPSIQMMQILWPGAMAVQAIHVAKALNRNDPSMFLQKNLGSSRLTENRK
jgi:hypothetical protein